MELPLLNVQGASHLQSDHPASQQEIGESSMKSLNDAIIQIPIESDGTAPKTICDPTSSEATSDIAEMNSLKRKLYKYAVKGKWYKAKRIYDEANETVHIPLTVRGDTALHVAVSANSITFVEELVKLVNTEDLKTPNKDGNTAFCVAAITGHVEFFQIMIKKNGKLPKIHRQDELLPVHLAALYGNKKFVEEHMSKELLENLTKEDIEKLFFMTINSGMYDVAMKLVDKYPMDLIVAKYDTDDKKITALHMLMQKQNPSEEPSIDMFATLETSVFKYIFTIGRALILICSSSTGNTDEETSSGCSDELKLLKKLWSHVTHKLEHKDIVELITRPSIVLFDAVKSGNREAVKWLLSSNPELLLIMKDPESGRNIIHIAALYKQYSIFYYILRMYKEVLTTIIRDVDNDGNNVLHLIARHPQEEPSNSTLNNHMLSEYKKFKDVQKMVPSALSTMKNKDGKTPIDILNASQNIFCKEVMKLTTESANTCIVVAVLVASIAFASALTVPGDKFDFRYVSFIGLNAFALMLSATSIVVFLSLFMRSRLVSKSVRSAQQLLILGLGFLFYSIVTMILAFITASFLLFDRTTNKKFQSIKYFVATLGVLPIGVSLGIMGASLKPSILDFIQRSESAK